MKKHHGSFLIFSKAYVCTTLNINAFQNITQAIVTTPVGADGKSRELAILLANRFPILLFQYLIILEELATLLANRFPVSN